jgi:hypothetical protein
MSTADHTSPPCWKIKHLAILIAVLAVGFGLLGIASTILLGPSGSKLSRLFWLGAWFPLLTLIALYLLWIDGWVVLGHPPRPIFDDPKDIELDSGIGMVWVLFFITSPWVSATTLGFAITRIIDPSFANRHWTIRYRRLYLMLFIGVLSLSLFIWDPLRVHEWIVD